MPFSSPTTTSAVNEKRRPPLTTLATRLISTTRSWRSRPAGLIDRSWAIGRRRVAGAPWRPSEAQTALARAPRERADPAVVAITAAVEDDPIHPGGTSTLGQELADAP